MTDFRRDSGIVNVLRLAAILGVCITNLVKAFSAEPLHQNEYFSFYALTILTAAVCIALFVFLPQAATAILKNPDLLVPIGLYVTARGFLAYSGRPGLSGDLATAVLILKD